MKEQTKTAVSLNIITLLSKNNMYMKLPLQDRKSKLGKPNIKLRGRYLSDEHKRRIAITRKNKNCWWLCLEIQIKKKS